MRRQRGSLPRSGVGVAPGGPSRHGLSAKIIAGMWRSQRGRCPICLRALPEPPVVDHDHELARSHPHPVTRGCARCVRALLCDDCNLLLGRARDDEAVLMRARAYLRMWREALRR